MTNDEIEPLEQRLRREGFIQVGAVCNGSIWDLSRFRLSFNSGLPPREIRLVHASEIDPQIYDRMSTRYFVYAKE